MGMSATTELWVELNQLNADYARAVDSGDWERWIELFTDDCTYRLVPRENHERNLPLATLAFHGKGMLLDRVFGIRETLFHDPYYQRHVVGPTHILAHSPQRVSAEANYSVFRTKRSELTEVFNVGRYLDTVVKTTGGLRFQERLCIYDSELIPNSIIYPI
jgi:salicylate 5-hydroxylase small subunit